MFREFNLGTHTCKYPKTLIHYADNVESIGNQVHSLELISFLLSLVLYFIIPLLLLLLIYCTQLLSSLLNQNPHLISLLNFFVLALYYYKFIIFTFLSIYTLFQLKTYLILENIDDSLEYIAR